MLNCMTAALLLQLVRYRDFQSRPASREAADRAIQYIGEHFREKIDCRLVARELGYHPNYLNTVIRDTTGMTLHEYIIRTRLKLALDLLLHTRLSGKEIADRCGWHDYSNFYRIFKERFAHSPQEVRALGIRPQL